MQCIVMYIESFYNILNKTFFFIFGTELHDIKRHIRNIVTIRKEMITFQDKYATALK